MKVNIESFLMEYKGVVPRELFSKMAKALLNGEREMEISEDEYTETVQRQRSARAARKIYNP